MITVFWDVFSVLWCVSKASWRHLLPQSSLWTLKDVGCCRFLLNVGTYLLHCKLSCETLKLSRVWVWKLLSLRLWWSVTWSKLTDVSKTNYGINPFYPDYIGDMFCRNVGIVLPRCMTSCAIRRYYSYWNLTNMEIVNFLYLLFYGTFLQIYTTELGRVYIYFFRIIKTFFAK
jgi:hypothetical protein